MTRARQSRSVAVSVVRLGLTLALLLSLSIVALMRQLPPGADRALAGTAVDRATLPATVPFRWSGGLPVVDARLGMTGDTLGFLFDTGAPVVYADAIAARFGGAVTGSTPTRSVDGTVEEAAVVRVAALALGDAEFRDVGGIVGWVHDEDPLACVTTNGVLGANLMEGAVWRIDYGARHIGVLPSTDGLDLGEAIALRFEVFSEASPSPVVRLGVGGGELRFLLDTGADAGLVVHPSDLEAVGIEVAADAPSMARIAAGARGVFAADVRYADLELTFDGAADRLAYPVAASDAIAAGVGIMGNTFLREFVVTIDWPERKVYLQPVAADRSVRPPPDPRSATTMWRDGQLIVRSLVRAGPAEADGLELGDALAAVDGRPVIAPSFGTFCEGLDPSGSGWEPMPGSVLTTADGRQHTVEVVRGFYD